MDNWVGGCHFYRIMKAWGQHPDLGEVWGAGNVSEGRQLVMIKNRQTRSEKKSFPERFPPNSQPREEVQI